MKKMNLIFALVVITALITSSCKKECDKHNHQTNQVFNITVNENTTYTYNLPSAPQNGNYSISQQPNDYITSAIQTTPSSNAMIYSYTPALNFVGSDMVVLSTQNPQHSGGCNGNHNGNCNNQCNHNGDHDNDDVSTITINFNVVAVKMTNTNLSGISTIKSSLLK